MCICAHHIYDIHTHNHAHIYTIDINKVDTKLTHAMHVKDRYMNGTFINKLTKRY